MRELPLDQLLQFAAAIMRQKLKQAALIALLVLGCVWYAAGFGVISVVITIITVFIFGLLAFLVWFWTAVFTGGRRQASDPTIIEGTAVDITPERQPRDMKEINPPGAVS